jgi:hypothetical protein
VDELRPPGPSPTKLKEAALGNLFVARDSTPLARPFHLEFLGPTKCARALQLDVELVEIQAVAVRWPGRFSRFALSSVEWGAVVHQLT